MLDFQVIYIYGTDGSGKSTVCRELVDALSDEGIKAKYKWMRFNHYLSKLVNAINRLTGLSYYVVYADGTRIGYHDYYKSRFIAALYCSSTLLDTFISTIFRLWIPSLISKKIIVLDRFVFDTIVDLSIDCKNPDFRSTWHGRSLKKFIHSKILPIYLSVDKEVILRRRPDTEFDRNFSEKIRLYNKIYADNSNAYKVNNNGRIEATLQTILEILNINEKENHKAALQYKK